MFTIIILFSLPQISLSLPLYAIPLNFKTGNILFLFIQFKGDQKYRPCTQLCSILGFALIIIQLFFYLIIRIIFLESQFVVIYTLEALREFYKSDAIVQAEALRFKRPSPSSLQHIPRTSLTPRRILIIGEFNVLLTSALFSLVESSIHSSSKYEIFFKPHPASNLSPSLIPKQNITVTNDDITKIASPDTIILVSSMSSAVFDCLLLGLQTYSHLYGYVNLSPLKCSDYSSYFSSSLELNELLDNPPSTFQLPHSTFIFSDDYQNWLSLLS